MAKGFPTAFAEGSSSGSPVGLAPRWAEVLRQAHQRIQAVAVDMALTNPNMQPVAFGTKQRWQEEIEAAAGSLRSLLEGQE